MSLEAISHLTETLSVLVTSLKEKEAENARLKEELEKQKLQTEVENSDSKFFQESHSEEQQWRIEFQHKLKKQKDKLEKTREALRKAEVEKTILTSATSVAPKTHDIFIYVYRNGTIQAAESEKAAMEFFDDDFENYVGEEDLSELKEKKDRTRAVEGLAKDGESLLGDELITLKRITVPFECKEEVDSELENARTRVSEEPKRTRKLPSWMKIGVTVKYLDRNWKIEDIGVDKVQLNNGLWVNPVKLEKV